MKKRIMQFPALYKLLKGLHEKWKIETGILRIKLRSRRPPLKIVIGASGLFNEDWVPTDIEYLNLLIPEHWEKCLGKGTVDAMLAEHVWEHLTPEEARVAARQCYEYLKPGGYLRIAVPDGFHPDQKYIEGVKVGGVGPGADDHKVLYNYQSLQDLFAGAGFKVELLEYFDVHGEFHFTCWDPQAGKIHRSKRYDARNADGELKYTSVILDAYKPHDPSFSLASHSYG